MRNDKLFQYIKTIIFIWLGASFAMSQSEINPHYSIRASQSRRAANVLAIPSGKEAVVGEMDGPAVIRHIWMTA